MKKVDKVHRKMLPHLSFWDNLLANKHSFFFLYYYFLDRLYIYFTTQKIIKNSHILPTKQTAINDSRIKTLIIKFQNTM